MVSLCTRAYRAIALAISGCDCVKAKGRPDWQGNCELLEGRVLLTASLPGMHLVDPSADHFGGQVIYLDFAGAKDVTYHGPVTVGPFDVPAYKAPAGMAGQEQSIEAEVLQEVQATFADSGMQFTLIRPEAETEYSTMYIGGDDSAFSAYGSFDGLAEAVDIGNRSYSDNALVFSNKVAEDIAGFVPALEGVIAHEAGHLLGYAHNAPAVGTGPLDSVAADDYPYKTADWNQADPWLFYYRECTSYVAWRMNRDHGTTTTPYYFTNYMVGPNGTTGHWGNASNWDDNARLIGFTVDHVPSVGAIAQWNTINHVAYVESVNGDGTVNVSEYNYNINTNPHNYGTRSVSPDWFIHISSAAETRLAAPTLSLPSNGATGVSTNSPFSWSQVTGNHGYRIIVSTNASDLTTDPDATGGTPANGFNYGSVAQNTASYTWTGTLSAGTTYYWKVHAKGATLGGTWSSQGSFTTASVVTNLPAPSLSAPSNGATGQSTTPAFSWSAVSNATSYRIMVATNLADLTTDPTSDTGGASVVINTTTTGTSYTPTTALAAGTTYYWSVKARNSTQYGNWSSQGSFTTSAPTSISDQQKQNAMVGMVNNYRGSLPTELVLAVAFQEGGQGAYYVDGSTKSPSFYHVIDGPWAQPYNNADGVMQVTSASGYHERSGTYTNTQLGYEHAIKDGTDFLNVQFNNYGTPWEAALHYNSGGGTLYTYKRNAGEPQYLAHVASNLQALVPSMFGLSNPDLVSKLQAAQQIVNQYLNNPSILSNQSVSYYSSWQTQLDNELHNIGIAAPTVTVTSPNGGENWGAGVAHTISWSVGGNSSQISNFLVSYSLDNGATYVNDVGTTASGNTSISWTPPLVISPTAPLRVRVQARNSVNSVLAQDSSDGSFTTSAAATRIISLSGNLAFGNVSVGSSPQSILTIYNNGNSMLTVSGVSYPSGFSGNWSGTIAAGGSHAVTVTFAPTSATTYGGTVTVNSDGTSGTNTIAASGSGTTVGNRAPTVTNVSKSVNQNASLAFVSADFTAAFADPDAGNTLQKIKITSLPLHGVLKLGTTAVTLNQEIAIGLIGTLVYTPSTDYSGTDTIGWNGSDGSLYAGGGAAVNLTVNAPNKTTTADVSFSPASPNYAESVTIIIRVTADAGTPTGAVSLSLNGEPFSGPFPLIDGVASVPGFGFPVGTFQITASYSGAASFNASISAPRALVVVNAPTNTALTSSGNPSTSDQAVLFTSTVTPTDGPNSLAEPVSGTIQFKVDGTDIGTPVVVVNGVANCTISTLTAGVYTITAVYSGDANFRGSVGTLSQTVNATADNAPNIPANSLPASGSAGTSLTPTLSASAFSDPDSGDTQAAAQWQVTRSSDGTVIYDSGEDAVNKTSIAVPSGKLADATAYTWQVRYKDSQGGWSDYSTATGFTTQQTIEPILTITSPNGGDTWQVGNSYTINWAITGNTANVTSQYLWLSCDQGASWGSTLTPDGISASARSFNFTLASSQGSTTVLVAVVAQDADSNVVVWNTNIDTFTIQAPLAISGTAGNDRIVVKMNGDMIVSRVNGVATWTPVDQVASITVNAGAGNDTVIINPGMMGVLILGGGGNDTLTGGDGNDTIKGGVGNDLIHGGRGDDLLLGNAGDDTLYGDAGNDTLNGGPGQDLMYGGGGNDTFYARDGGTDTLFGGAGTNTAFVDDLLDSRSQVEVLA